MLQLPLARYRFTFTLQRDFDAPPFMGALLRSVFGAALRRTVCVTGEQRCPSCAMWRGCAYPAIFETPPAPTQFEQKFSQVPNPYVIEPPLQADGARCAAGTPLQFHMVLIGPPTLSQLGLIIQSWRKALHEGLGPHRVRGDLLAVDERRVDGSVHTVIAPGRDAPSLAMPAPWSPLPEATAAPSVVHLHCTSPLRLQHQGRELRIAELTPRTLVSQLLRRISLMLELHMGHPHSKALFDPHALVRVAEGLHDDRSALQWVDLARFSARQGQAMQLGGAVGTWTLRGEGLGVLLPWLQLGQWLHVGKNATMGLGGYRLQVQR